MSRSIRNRFALSVAALALVGCSGVEPGHRGVKVVWNEVDANVLGEGYWAINPFSTSVISISVQQETRETEAPCFSSDLQQVKMKLKVLYRVPEKSVVSIYKDYKGDVFDSLISPRVQEAIKEATSAKTAEGIVKTREVVKQEALAATKKKLGELIEIDDLVIENIDLSTQLEQAIEAKMVQQQESQKAEFTKAKAMIDAETTLIAAKAEADSIKIRGEALKTSPELVQFKLAERWNGVSPTVVVTSGDKGGANIMLPIGAAPAAAK